MKTLLAGLLALTFCAGMSAQDVTVNAKLHPYLSELLDHTPATDYVPVYFVLGDRLGYDHWFPRVWSMGIEERRQVVMSELKLHATRTQAELIAYLEREVTLGGASGISSNWLGNFVRVQALPEVIRAAASLPSVSEVWFDHVPELSEVEDGATFDVIGEPTASALPVPREGDTLPPGNGPAHTRADLVWSFGIDGTGVIAMNSDSGINTSHGDLVNRLWVNAGEIPGNNIDDDNNGYVDDINGWDFGSNNNSIYSNGGHGTNTAGCIVADGACSGTIYGQAPGAKVMTGQLSGESSQWDSIQYAIQMGAHTQTSSHSYKNNFNPPPNYKMHRDVGETSLAAGLIRTNSTSNNGTSCGSSTSYNRKPFNISAPGNLPPPYMDPNQTLVGNLGGVLGIGAHSVSNNTLLSYSPCGPYAWDLNDLLAVRPTYPVGNWDPNDNDYPWNGGASQALLKPDLTSPTGTTTTNSGSCGTTTFSGTSNATPVANGCAVLWKSANMSLGPEDIGMIAHQTSISSGSVAGKENDWGAGRIDALNGAVQALCVHRVDGQPAWALNHQVGTSINVQIDSIPSSSAVLAFGAIRTANQTFGGVIGIGGFTALVWWGSTNGNGDVSLSFPVDPSLAGFTIYTQAFVNDTTVTGTVLSSNVIGTTFVP